MRVPDSIGVGWFLTVGVVPPSLGVEDIDQVRGEGALGQHLISNIIVYCAVHGTYSWSLNRLSPFHYFNTTL